MGQSSHCLHMMSGEHVLFLGPSLSSMFIMEEKLISEVEKNASWWNSPCSFLCCIISCTHNLCCCLCIRRLCIISNNKSSSSISLSAILHVYYYITRMKMHACTHTTLQLSTIPQVHKAAPVVPQITAHIWHVNYVIDRTQRFIVFRIGCM